MELAFALTAFGIVLTIGTFVQNHLLNKQTDKMIQREDARAKELLAKLDGSIAETRNMVAETRNMVAETRNMVVKMDERMAESEKERRAHEKFMEELLARIHERTR